MFLNCINYDFSTAGKTRPRPGSSWIIRPTLSCSFSSSSLSIDRHSYSNIVILPSIADNSFEDKYQDLLKKP